MNIYIYIYISILYIYYIIYIYTYIYVYIYYMSNRNCVITPGWRLMRLGYRTCFHTLYDEKKYYIHIYIQIRIYIYISIYIYIYIQEEKIRSNCKNPNDQARSGKVKTMDSEAVLKAIEANRVLL